MVERFLRPIGMEFMAKAFIENKINGAVLMCLNEDHMKEMGCAVLGEEWVGQGRRGCGSVGVVLWAWSLSMNLFSFCMTNNSSFSFETFLYYL